mmetsp:Transcript_8127/g.19188  ORF Transcript_8127/g.19188 Transcript_8127/m.19188 type:complete len:224 (-) Transcript_8127:1193-1864(-)
MPGVVKGMESDHISVQHALQDGLSMLELAEDLTRGEGDVKEVNHLDGSLTGLLDLGVMDHLGQEREVIVMDPNHIVGAEHHGHNVGEDAVDGPVGRPPTIELRLVPVAFGVADVHLVTGTLANDDLHALPLSPAARGQVEQVDVVEARPQDLLAHAEVVSLLDLLVEEDGSTIHGSQDGADGILVFIGGDGRVGRDGTNPVGFVCLCDGVRLRLGNERFGPAC